jgi:hypothetical protein
MAIAKVEKVNIEATVRETIVSAGGVEELSNSCPLGVIHLVKSYLI